jgi:hypothetical protein
MKSDDFTIPEIMTFLRHDLWLLPAFQRPFKWNTEQIARLFDSILRDLPIGSLTLAKPNFALGIVGLNKEDERDKVGTPVWHDEETFQEKKEAARRALGKDEELYLILDGQQRVTAIWRALTGTDDVYVTFPGGVFADHITTLSQLSRVIGDEDEAVTDTEPSTRLSVKISSLTQAIVTDQVLRRAFRETRFCEELLKDHSEHSSRFTGEEDRYITLTRGLHALWSQLKIPVIIADTGQKDLVDFFDRTNTAGTPLGFFDLINCRTFDKFSRKNDPWKSFSHALDDTFSKNLKARPRTEFPKAQEHFIRARLYEDLAAIKDPAPVSNPLAKGPILENVKGDMVHPNFVQWVDDFGMKPITFLQDWKLATYHDSIPFPLMVLPTFFFLKCFGWDQTRPNSPQSKFFKWWYWASIFSERYSYKTNEAAHEDIIILKGVAEGIPVIPADYVKTLQNRLNAGSIGALRGGNGHYQKAILQLGLNNLDSKCLYRGQPLSSLPPDLTLQDKIKKAQKHHIIPKGYLIRKGYSYHNGSLANSIAALMYASANSHRAIACAPSEYLTPDNEYGIDPDVMTTHFCSQEMSDDLQAGRYDDPDLLPEFVTRRAEEMFGPIDTAAGDVTGNGAVEPFLGPHSTKELVRLFG